MRIGEFLLLTSSERKQHGHIESLMKSIMDQHNSKLMAGWF